MLRNNCTNLVRVLFIPASDLQNRKLKTECFGEMLKESVDILL